MPKEKARGGRWKAEQESLKKSFVRTGARGRLLAETQNRFSQNPRPVVLFPFYLSPICPCLALSPIVDSIPPSFSVSVSFRLYSFPPFRIFVYSLLSFFFPLFFVTVQMRPSLVPRPCPVTLTSIQIKRPENHTRGLPRTIKGIINFTFRDGERGCRPITWQWLRS